MNGKILPFLWCSSLSDVKRSRGEHKRRLLRLMKIIIFVGFFRNHETHPNTRRLMKLTEKKGWMAEARRNLIKNLQSTKWKLESIHSIFFLFISAAQPFAIILASFWHFEKTSRSEKKNYENGRKWFLVAFFFISSSSPLYDNLKYFFLCDEWREREKEKTMSKW